MRAQTLSGELLVPGTNKDHVDIDAGLKELVAAIASGNANASGLSVV